MNKKEYAPEWHDVIRPSILKRDNYQCKECGIPHRVRVYRNASGAYVECDDFTEEWAKNNGKSVFTLYLQVAHMDHDKTNNDPSNLLTLCPIHHARYDNAHKKSLRGILKQKDTVKNSIEFDNYLDKKAAFLKNFRAMFLELTGSKLSKSDLDSIYTFIHKNFNHE